MHLFGKHLSPRELWESIDILWIFASILIKTFLLIFDYNFDYNENFLGAKYMSECGSGRRGGFG